MDVNLLQLNLPNFEFDIRDLGQSKQIFDLVRRKFVSLTPEEWVRQHFLRFMIQQFNFSPAFLAVEKQVKVNGLSQRADIVAYNKSLQPVLIVECKAPSIALDQNTFFQAARYNLSLNVRYFVLTNGLNHYCLYFNGKNFEYLNELPNYNSI